MKRKIINVVELVLHLITLIVLFASKCPNSTKFTGEYYNGRPVYASAQTFWFEEIMATPIYFIPLVILWATSIVMCTISAFSKQKGVDGKMHSAMPIINFVVTIWCMISLPASNGFFYVIILMFFIIIIGFVKRAKIIVDKTNTTMVNSVSSELDELKKLKELLDSGVISQKEFDEKKKQLLGI